MKPEHERQQRRKKLEGLKRELRKIKNDFKRVHHQHHQDIINESEFGLHPQAQCSLYDCPISRTACQIDIMKHQFNKAETEVKRLERIIQAENEESSEDGFFDIENLPEELILEIFKYLNLDDLCRAGRVCKTWYQMTRSNVFWKRIQANVDVCSSSIPEATFQLINLLPSIVTSISLNFDDNGYWFIEYNEFTNKLRERCPNLQILVLNHIIFEIDTDELVILCMLLPKSVRVLALPNCNFYLRGFTDESDDAVSNIEVLDLSECCWTICSRFSLIRMPNLKKLHLAGCEYLHDEFLEPIGSFIDQLEVLNLERTQISNVTFQAIINHSQHLTELYVCWTLVKDNDLIFIKEQKGFPCLKIICLRGCEVTAFGIFSLIKSCPTLQRVFVGNKELVSTIGCPSFDPEIVKDVGFGYCNHSKNVDYMLE